MSIARAFIIMVLCSKKRTYIRPNQRKEKVIIWRTSTISCLAFVPHSGQSLQRFVAYVVNIFWFLCTSSAVSKLFFGKHCMGAWMQRPNSLILPQTWLTILDRFQHKHKHKHEHKYSNKHKHYINNESNASKLLAL